MKKLAFLVGAILILSFFFLNKKEDKVVVSESEKVITLDSKKLFFGARKKISPEKLHAEAVNPCDGLQAQLDNLDFSLTKKEWLENLKLDSFKACLDKDFQERITLVEKSCFDKKISSECETHIVFLRSQLRSRIIKDPSDSQELADLIMNEISKGQNSDFKLLEKLTSKLMDINPHEGIQKFWALSKLLSQKDIQNVSPEIVDEIFRRTKPEIWNDPQLIPLEIALKTGFRPDKVENFVLQSMAEFPDNFTLHEILGWSLWKQNRREEALSALDRAIQLNPKDQHLKNMRERLKNPKADGEAYEGRINLSVNFDDLFV